MRYRNAIILSFVLVATALSGCSMFGGNRVAVSDYLRQQFTLQEAELKQLQVYVSETITLERVVDSTGSDIEQGELNVFGEKLEQIVISSKTPGIVLQATDRWAKVSFSEGTWLYFGSFASTGNDPWGGKYALFAEKWSDGIGYLEFNGLAYRAVKKSGQAVLEIRQNDLKKNTVKKKKLPGVSLDSDGD